VDVHAQACPYLSQSSFADGNKLNWLCFGDDRSWHGIKSLAPCARKPYFQGEKLPVFQLKTLENENFSSEQFKGSAWLLIFYRGNWCPLCMTQIGEVAARYIDLDRFGVKVALISPQPEVKTKELASRFKVPMKFFVDADFKASTKLKLVHDHGVPFGLNWLGHGEDTVLPTVLMINKHGRIVYSDQTSNYRVRPEPEQFLEVARQKLVGAES